MIAELLFALCTSSKKFCHTEEICDFNAQKKRRMYSLHLCQINHHIHLFYVFFVRAVDHDNWLEPVNLNYGQFCVSSQWSHHEYTVISPFHSFARCSRRFTCSMCINLNFNGNVWPRDKGSFPLLWQSHIKSLLWSESIRFRLDLGLLQFWQWLSPHYWAMVPDERHTTISSE